MERYKLMGVFLALPLLWAGESDAFPRPGLAGRGVEGSNGVPRRFGSPNFRQPVTGARFLSVPHSPVLVSGGADLRLFALPGGSLQQVLSTGRVVGLEVSDDGSRIAVIGSTAAGSRTLEFWDSLRGSRLWEVRERGWLSCATISADASLVTYVEGEGIRIVSGRSGRVLGSLDAGGPRSALNFSRDGETVFGLIHDRFEAWRWRDGRRLFSRRFPQERLQDLVVLPISGIVAIAGLSGRIYFCDPATGRSIRSDLTHDTALWRLSVSADERRLAASSLDSSSLVVWDLAEGSNILHVKLPRGSPVSLALSPDGERLFSGSDKESVIRVWSVATGEEAFEHVGHTEAVTGGFFLREPNSVVTSARDGRLILWGRASGRPERVWESGHRGGVSAIASLGEGRLLASAGPGEPIVYIWDIPSESRVRDLHLEGPVTILRAGPDRRTLAVAVAPPRRAAEILLFRVSDWSVERRLIVEENVSLSGLTFSPDGRRLGASLYWRSRHVAGGRAILWSLEDGARILDERNLPPAYAIDWHPEGTAIATGHDHLIRIRQIENPGTVRFLNNKLMNSSLAFSPRGQLAVGGCLSHTDGALEIWSPTNESSPARRSLRVHDGSILSLEWIDDRHVLSTSLDATAVLTPIPVSESGALFRGGEGATHISVELVKSSP